MTYTNVYAIIFIFYAFCTYDFIFLFHRATFYDAEI